MNAAAPTARLMQSSSADLGCSKMTVEGKVYARLDLGSKARPDASHPWELAGLGHAPYRLLASGTCTFQACPEAPIQPGTSCDYCGQGISVVYSIRAACGSIFRVGCDCVRKATAGRDDSAEVASKVEAAAKKHRNALARASKARRDSANADTLATLRAANIERLSSLPHPRGFEGKTALDWLDYMIAHCGAAGRARVVRDLQALLLGWA